MVGVGLRFFWVFLVYICSMYFSIPSEAAGGNKKRGKHRPAAKYLRLTSMVRFFLLEDVTLGLTHYFLSLYLAF